MQWLKKSSRAGIQLTNVGLHVRDTAKTLVKSADKVVEFETMNSLFTFEASDCVVCLSEKT